MTRILSAALGAGLLAATATVGFAQGQAQPAPDKPTLSGFLQQGYDIVHIDGAGGQFIFFILRKERTLVHCSVLLQSGETSSCRTLK